MGLIRKIFLENIALKFIAIIAAFMLWLFVITEKEYTHEYKFGLEIYGLSKKYTLKYPVADSVRVMLTGKGRELLKLNFEDMRATIDASTFTTGKHIAELNAENFVIPVGNVRIEEIIEPTIVEIVLDYLDKKEIPVENRLMIEPADGYVVEGQITFEPPTIMVGGPQSELRKIESISTVDKKISGLRVSTTLVAELDTTGLKVVPVTRRVIASIPIDHIASKSFRDIPVRLRNAPRGYRGVVKPRTIDLTLSGSRSALEELTERDVEVYVDYNQIALEGDRIRPIIKTQPYIRVSSKKPEYFMIED